MQVAEYWTSEMVMTVSGSSEEGRAMGRVELEEEAAKSADSSSNRVDSIVELLLAAIIILSVFLLGVGYCSVDGRWLMVWFALLMELFHILCVVVVVIDRS